MLFIILKIKRAHLVCVISISLFAVHRLKRNSYVGSPSTEYIGDMYTVKIFNCVVAPFKEVLYHQPGLHDYMLSISSSLDSSSDISSNSMSSSMPSSTKVTVSLILTDSGNSPYDLRFRASSGVYLRITSAFAS